MNKSRLMHLFLCGSGLGLCVVSTAMSGEHWPQTMGGLLFGSLSTVMMMLYHYTDAMDEWWSQRPAIDSYCIRCRCHASHCWRSHEGES